MTLMQLSLNDIDHRAPNIFGMRVDHQISLYINENKNSLPLLLLHNVIRVCLVIREEIMKLF